jgi:hypothetical protein
MPEVAAVITATFPSSFPICLLLNCVWRLPQAAAGEDIPARKTSLGLDHLVEKKVALAKPAAGQDLLAG